MTPAPDLALGKPAFASTIEGPSFTPAMAVDGNSSTRWSSGQWMQPAPAGSTSTWAAPYQRGSTQLGTAYAVNYQIQVSDDALNWVAIQAVSGNQGKGLVDFTGLSATGRYVRIDCTRTSAGSDNFSLYDLQVYGIAAAPVSPAARGVEPTTPATGPAPPPPAGSHAPWGTGTGEARPESHRPPLKNFMRPLTQVL